MKRPTKKWLRGILLEVEELMDELGMKWGQAMKGVDVHPFRKSHKTWAQSYGVPPTATDKQLGHSSFRSGGETAMILGSVTGRKHYLDIASPLFDAGASARAVRILLDDAMTQAMKGNSQKSVPILVPIDQKRVDGAKLSKA
jgi:hypothetical protein